MIKKADVQVLKKQLFNIENEDEFESIALQVFNYQAKYNNVYKEYLLLLNTNPDQVLEARSIPFLPIDFFKERKVISGNTEHELIFRSSGTTGTNHSQHFVTETHLYETSFLKAFELFYHSPADYTILALLPTYTERNDSSLVFMMNRLIRDSNNELSGLYQPDDPTLTLAIKKLIRNGKRFILWGVTFALLDLAEKFEFDFENNIILETGGMKGKRKEIVRDELHKILCDRFQVASIHSEYGMTELLSQAYSKGNGLFHTPPWMKILIRDVNDPLDTRLENKTGGINIIDLANINSCSFIATQDVGKIAADGSFEVLGRFDNSEMRGCNLLFQ